MHLCDNLNLLIMLAEQDCVKLAGGFSMGAALSLYYGYQYGRTLAGIFALSGFLNKDSAVYEVRHFPMITCISADKTPLAIPLEKVHFYISSHVGKAQNFCWIFVGNF